MRIDEVSLDRDTGEVPPAAPPPPRRGPGLLIAAAVIAGILAALVYFVWIGRRPAPAAQPAPTTSTDVPVAPVQPLALPDEPLPPLSASDSFVRRVVALLSEHPALARWLASDALIERTATAIEQIGDGRTPAEPFAFLRPSTRAATVRRGSGLVVDPASFRRWDEVAGVVMSADPAQAAEVYKHLRPLFVETYRGMGHPDGNFDAAIGRAAGRVLATPIVEQPLGVETRRGYLEHTDAQLRGLAPVSRQLLLMGSANLRRLQEWTNRFLDAAAIEPR